MFAPCPHCGYLMALIATADPAPRECPRCHRLVDTHVQPPVRSVPTAAASGAVPTSRTPTAAPSPVEASPARASTVPFAGSASNVQCDLHTTPDVPAAPASPDASTGPATTASITHDDDADPTATADQRAVDATSATATPPSPVPLVERIDASPPPRVAGARGAAAARASTSPSFAHRRRHSIAMSPRTTWAWRLGAFALAAVLALQLLLSQSDTLAQDARWRPWLARVCGVGLCTVPPGRDASAFEMVERSVRPLPGSRELAVHARFRNAAPWPQAWPHLQLVLSDAQGRPAAARVFAPADYAGDMSRRAIAPGQTVHAQLRVVEPQPATVAFAFDFR